MSITIDLSLLMSIVVFSEHSVLFYVRTVVEWFSCGRKPSVIMVLISAKIMMNMLTFDYSYAHFRKAFTASVCNQDECVCTWSATAEQLFVSPSVCKSAPVVSGCEIVLPRPWAFMNHLFCCRFSPLLLTSKHASVICHLRSGPRAAPADPSHTLLGPPLG